MKGRTRGVKGRIRGAQRGARRERLPGMAGQKHPGVPGARPGMVVTMPRQGKPGAPEGAPEGVPRRVPGEKRPRQQRTTLGADR